MEHRSRDSRTLCHVSVLSSCYDVFDIATSSYFPRFSPFDFFPFLPARSITISRFSSLFLTRSKSSAFDIPQDESINHFVHHHHHHHHHPRRHHGPEEWWSKNATIEDWFDEMVGIANIINKYAAVRIGDIKGRNASLHWLQRTRYAIRTLWTIDSTRATRRQVDTRYFQRNKRRAVLSPGSYTFRGKGSFPAGRMESAIFNDVRIWLRLRFFDHRTVFRSTRVALYARSRIASSMRPHGATLSNSFLSECLGVASERALDGRKWRKAETLVRFPSIIHSVSVRYSPSSSEIRYVTSRLHVIASTCTHEHE